MPAFTSLYILVQDMSKLYLVCTSKRMSEEKMPDFLQEVGHLVA